MTVDELGAVIRGIAPVVKEHVQRSVDGYATRLDALEKSAVPEPVVPLEELATSFTGLMRKELSSLDASHPIPMQKRAIYKDGKIDRVVEEPAEPV